jgi:positive regulator of sigma E activity
MKETGEIISIDEINHKITIKLESSKACDECKLCSKNKRKEIIIDIPENMNYSKNDVGEKVVLNISNHTFLYITSLLYGLPLIMLFIGYCIGSFFFGKQIFGVLGSFFFVITYYFVLKKLNLKCHMITILKKI